ncbi:hypothetical protein ELR76_23995 [Salmonella enterica subsp. enterica serovar Menston]|nr:hypothetical protein [Salmonella enterica subsp. enterica serovar Menston]
MDRLTLAGEPAFIIIAVMHHHPLPFADVAQRRWILHAVSLCYDRRLSAQPVILVGLTIFDT